MSIKALYLVLLNNDMGCRILTYLLLKVRNKLSALYSSSFTSGGVGAASLSFLNPRFSRLLHISSVDISSTGILCLKKNKIALPMKGTHATDNILYF